MDLLAINCGSSSLKFALYRADAGDFEELATGEVERINDAPVLHATAAGGDPHESSPGQGGHEAAAAAMLDWIAEIGALPSGRLDVVGHRVVHGGPSLRDATVLDDAAVDAIEQAGELAQLHNAPALAVIHALRRHLGPGVPQVAVFDTAFHRDMPPRAARYAIPADLADRHGIERFGFHGLAHAAMVEAVAAAEGTDPARLRVVTLQLGSGCSAAAVDGGRSIDTSMGLTPLEGLMMSTRSGDVDPALPGLLARREGVSVEQVEAWLNHESGLLGVSGRSADIRDLLDAEAGGDRRAALAIEMFCYRVGKQIGAYLAALGGADAVAFGGGIGEHQPELRRRIGEPLAWAGLHLDDARNREAEGTARITGDGAPLAAYVVRVDEQRAIAREAYRRLA